jgi:hypothetical protein
MAFTKFSPWYQSAVCMPMGYSAAWQALKIYAPQVLAHYMWYLSYDSSNSDKNDTGNISKCSSSRDDDITMRQTILTVHYVVVFDSSSGLV